MKRSRHNDFSQLQPLIISDPEKAQQIALNYLKDVRDMFHDQNDKYAKFIDIMKDYKAERVNTTGVIARVKELFRGHRELILGFNTFLPKGHEIVLPQEDGPHAKKVTEFQEAEQFVHKVKMRFQGDDHAYRSFLDIMNMCRNKTKSTTEVHREVAALLHNHQDLLIEFTNFLPHYVDSGRTHKPCLGDRSSPVCTINPLHSENVISILDVSAGVADHYHDNEHTIHGEKERVIRIKKEQHSQDKHFDSHGSNRVTRKHKAANTLEDTVTELFHPDLREQVISLREKVKERLQSSDDYQAFLKCIMHYHTENITRPQLQSLVNDLLGAYPDLMEKVNGFIDRSEKNEDQYQDQHRDKDHENDELNRCHEIKGSKNVSAFESTSLLSNNEYQAKPIHELDLSDCEQCTPSYRLLPKNYPIPSASQRTKIGVEVLNDHWVSVTSGSEDYSFKHMRKNQYEESLFRCEDDRFELDILLESVNVTARRVEELLDKINNHSIKSDSPVLIEDHLTALNLRCIERLYGDSRLDVMDVLKKNASLALPVILTRLKQKQDEWARCRFDFNKIWAEVYAKNYHRSLDHRSFYFKQQDSKSLSAKALLVEIKEISQEKSEDESIYQHFASRERQNSTPHQEFNYCDMDVHEDLYQVIKYYIPQYCTTEQFEKVMEIWTSFVEPMFNVPIRRHLITKNGRKIEEKKENKEREEGELSPSEDFEEDNFASLKKNGTEESAHRSSCDSSGSETADLVLEDRSPDERDGGHVKKAENEGEAVERFLVTAKPLTKYVPAISPNDENDSRVFYGNDDFYVLFRLHQTLYSRLREAKENSANDKWRGSNDATPNDSYARFLDLLYTFLGGDADNAKYEDECRTILGTWSFPLFTLDKLIYKLSKQLLAIAMDEFDEKLLSLYTYEHMRKPGRFVDEVYYAHARALVNDDNIYRFQHSLISKTDSQTQLTIRLMDPGCDTSEAPSFAIYPNIEACPTSQLVPGVPGKKRAHIFLKRNKRKYACEDEDLAMMQAIERVQILNRMECKINSSTHKISYVLDTEDSMLRKGRKKVNSQRIQSIEFADVSNSYSHKAQKFHKLLESRLLACQHNKPV